MTGPRYMLLSAAGFAIMGALVKVAGAAGVPLLQIIAARAVISILLSLANLRGTGLHPLGNQRWLLLARGVVGFISLSCVFYAVLNLPYAQATLLQYMHPIFTAILAYLFLREIPAKATVACVALSLLGLGVLLLPAVDDIDSATVNGWAVLAGLAGAFGSGLAYTIVRKLAPTEHSAVIVLYFPMVCVPAAFILGWKDFIWPDPLIWLVLLGVGCFTQVGQICLTRAMRTDSASRATSLSYLQIVFAAVLGALFFGEIPSGYTLAGASLILTGAVANALISRYGARPAAT